MAAGLRRSASFPWRPPAWGRGAGPSPRLGAGLSRLLGAGLPSRLGAGPSLLLGPGLSLLFGCTSPGAPEPVASAPASTSSATGSAPRDPASAAPPPVDAPSPGTSAMPEPGACAALPDARPVNLVLRFQRTILPQGGDARREGLELRADSACPSVAAPGSAELLPCRRVSTAELDRIHRELLALGLRSLRGDPSRPTGSPHIGSRQLSLEWPGGACAIVDGVGRRIHADDERAFFAAIDVVVGAVPR